VSKTSLHFKQGLVIASAGEMAFSYSQGASDSVCEWSKKNVISAGLNIPCKYCSECTKGVEVRQAWLLLLK
jgi:hypothetical protein